MSNVGRAAETEAVRRSPKDVTELTLEELMKMEIPTVYGASKYEQKITEAPSSVTIITTNEIQRYGYRTLADVLESVRGFHVSYDRFHSFLGARGFNRGDFNSRVLILIDGHRMNNNLSDGGSVGTEFMLDVDLIERVEIIRGPGSVLYGNNAFFGVINVITKRGAALQGSEGSGEVASFDTYKGRLSYGYRFKTPLEFLVSGTIYDSDGPLKDRVDHDHFGSFFGTLGLYDFTLQGGFISRAKGVPFPAFGAIPEDPRNRATDERSYGSLKFAHDFPQVVEVTAQLYYDRQDFDSQLVFGSATNLQQQVGEWWGSELQLTKRIDEGRHTFTLGAEYRDDFRQESRNQNIGFAENVRREERQNHGVYFQGDVGILTNLHLVGGVRYDQYGRQKASFNPRLALIYNPFDRSVFKAIYGTAFRAPNFFELFFNADLTPETITTYELVYEQGFGPQVRSTVALFYNDIDDLIDTRQQGPFIVAQNIKGARARGAELELEARAVWDLVGRVSYTFQETEDSETGKTLTDSPKHLAKFNVSAPLLRDKIFVGVEYQYTSRRTSFLGGEAGGYGVLNFTLFSRSLLKGLEFSAGVYNVLDKHYADPAPPFVNQRLIAQDGRAFRVKLAYRF